jgi:hypothetical protein
MGDWTVKMECIPTGGLAVDEEEAAAKDDEAALPLTLPPLVASNEIAAPGGRRPLRWLLLPCLGYVRGTRNKLRVRILQEGVFTKGLHPYRSHRGALQKGMKGSIAMTGLFHFFYHAKRFPAGRHTLSHEKLLAGR